MSARETRESFTDAELRMTALGLAQETAPEGQTTGGILWAAEQIYKWLTGGTVSNADGQIKVLSADELSTRH
jgi:hypothetical protein